MRILYERGEKPLKGDTKVGETVFNERDGITYTKNKYGDIIVVAHSFAASTTPTPTPPPTNLPVVPIGGIIMYHGAFGKIPKNFALCDGSGITPDLRGRFVLGAVNELNMGVKGGSADAVIVSHAHKMTHTHSMAHQHTMAHTHTITHDHPIVISSGNTVGHVHNLGGGWHTMHEGTGAKINVLMNMPHIAKSNTRGNNVSHTHATDVPNFVGSSGASSATKTGGSDHAVTGNNNPAITDLGGVSGKNKNLPPFFTLAFIMRIK